MLIIRTRSSIERIAIVGAGEFGIQAAHVIREINGNIPKYEIVG